MKHQHSQNSSQSNKKESSNISLKRNNRFVMLIGALAFIALFIINILRESKWMYDNVLSLAFIMAIYKFNDKLWISKKNYWCILTALLMHNMGMFTAYNLHINVFEFDNALHFFASAVAAWTVFNFIVKTIEEKTHQAFHKQVYDNTYSFIEHHPYLVILLVIACTSLLGLGVELLEFTGAVVLGEGEGILFVGPGDTGISQDTSAQFTDTMTDFISNLVGCIAGTGAYYLNSKNNLRERKQESAKKGEKNQEPK